jgi:hypothetical protein
MAKFAVMPHAQGLVAGQPDGRQASLGSTYSALVAPVFFRKVFAVAVISGLDNTRWTNPVGFAAAQRWTSTGILQWVRTFTVSLPRTIAEMPWRPCEAMTIKSQAFEPAVSMIAR